MAKLFHVERDANKITLGTTGTTINVASHTASKTLALDGSKNLESIQDLRTTADPTFAALAVTTINSLGVEYTAVGNIGIGDATTLDALDANPEHNIAIGNGAGSGITNGDDNIFIGYRAGYQHTTGGHNIAIGYEASYSGSIIGGLTVVGYQAAKYLGSGNGNTCIGYQAGKGDFGGASYVYNTFIGEMAGSRINNGGSNVCLGKNSGTLLFDGDRNIFLGFDAGRKQTDNSDLLIIDNRGRTNTAAEITDCLIYGVMAAAPADQSLRINAEILGSDGAKIGDGGATNYTQFGTDGRQTMAGTARVWDCVDLDPIAINNPGGGPGTNPANDDIDDFRMHRYDDTVEEEVWFLWHVPSDYAEGTANVRGHFDLVVDGGGGIGDTVVRMGYDWMKLSPGDIFSWAGAGPGFMSETIPSAEASWAVHETDTGVLPTTGWAYGDIILFRFFRDATAGADTYIGDAWVLTYHLDYLRDKLGEVST